MQKLSSKLEEEQTKGHFLEESTSTNTQQIPGETDRILKRFCRFD